MQLSRRAFLASEAASGPLEAGGPGYRSALQACGPPCRKPPSPSPRWELGGRTLRPAQPPPAWALAAHLRAGRVLPRRLASGEMQQPGRCLGGQVTGERLVGMELLQGMGAGKLDQATGAVALSPNCM